MSDAMKALQVRCGCTPDGQFGPNTARGVMKHYELSPERAAHLLGQASHESGYFRYDQENLNYSASGLHKVFRRYFPTVEDAEPYARNPEKIANYVYMDKHRSKGGALGNVFDGDGYLFKGRGWIMCTGRTNYRQLAADMRIPEILQDPSRVATDYAFESAMWFFDKKKLWRICDKGVNDEVIEEVSRIVNGGTKGMADRKEQTFKIYRWLTA